MDADLSENEEAGVQVNLRHFLCLYESRDQKWKDRERQQCIAQDLRRHYFYSRPPILAES